MRFSLIRWLYHKINSKAFTLCHIGKEKVLEFFSLIGIVFAFSIDRITIDREGVNLFGNYPIYTVKLANFVTNDRRTH
jgi:hypothetical protein